MNRTPTARTVSITALAPALVLFALWTLATWCLEGRIDTLRRPEAVADRAIYAIVANLLIGVVLAIAALRFSIRRKRLARKASGFGPAAPSTARLTIAATLGLGLYVVQGAPSLDPIVLTNAFAQVLVVSIAEIVVCWAVLGTSVEALLRTCGRVAAVIGAGLVASVLFGAYHLAHSTPFNTPAMVALLTVVGLVTSTFFFVTRDVYATIVFHNFLALFGVVRALEASGELRAFTSLQPPLLAMAAIAVVTLALADRMLLRTSETTDSR